MLLDGKRLLITGVLTDDSIAYAVAERAQRAGAEVVLTGFGRGLRITERMARRLPPSRRTCSSSTSTTPDHLEAVAAELDERWGALDGVLHAIAFAPPEALGGRFLDDAGRSRPRRRSARAPSRSRRWPPGCCGAARARARRRRDRRPGLRRHASPGRSTTGWASPRPRWRRSTATWPATSGRAGCAPTSSPRARSRTMAARGIDGFDDLAGAWQRQAPLGWDVRDPGPVADACLFLLSDLARAVTGEVLHVDGGYHALGAPLPSGGRE